MASILEIALHAAYKVGRTDDFTLQMAQIFVSARHRQVYEAFDWKSAQISSTFPLLIPVESVSLPGVDHVISVRWRDKFLDPVSTQFIFDTRPELLSATGEPEFYNEFYDQQSGVRNIRFYPAPGDDEILGGVQVYVLGKRPFDINTTTLLVPYCQQALISYTHADLLDWLHQPVKAQAKLAEAEALMQNAKAMDTPAATRPRQGKVLTVMGNSLSELTDSVCDILGLWNPETRISVQERIRRNWQTIWEAALWPESTVVARLAATSNEQIILPSYFDRVIKVRSDNNPSVELQNKEISSYFNVDPQIFERVGDPTDYAMLSSVGVAVLPPFSEGLRFSLLGNTGLPSHEKITVFVKGESRGSEASETVLIDNTLFSFSGDPDQPAPPPPPSPGHDPHTQFSYDTPLTVSKPTTTGTLRVFGRTSGRLLLSLSPQERERKFIRIWLLPNQHTATGQPAQLFLILGKRKMSPLVADEDTCQLRNVENILINGAAADMLDKIGNATLAKTLRDKAAANLQIMMDGETRQNAHNSIVTPYVEPSANWDFN